MVTSLALVFLVLMDEKRVDRNDRPDITEEYQDKRCRCWVGQPRRRLTPPLPQLDRARPELPVTRRAAVPQSLFAAGESM
jgi:hypothetical protein